MRATSVVSSKCHMGAGFLMRCCLNMCVCVIPANRVAFLQHCVQDEWICAGRLGLSLGLYFGGHRGGEVSRVKAAAGL